MMISTNLTKILSKIPKKIKLVAVSKTQKNELILEAYKTGQIIFAENRVPELCEKYQQLPKDIQWHFIGHLQTNKVKYIAGFVDFIHSVDTIKLLEKINSEAAKHHRIIPCLLELHIAQEQSKQGFSYSEIDLYLSSGDFKNLKNIKIAGLMGMATYTEDENQIRNEFLYIKNCFDELKSKYFLNDADFKELSIGMSGDFHIAVECGSTMVRIGSSIFDDFKI